MVDTLFRAHTLYLGDFYSLLQNVEVCIENGFFHGIFIILSHLTRDRPPKSPGVAAAMSLCIKHKNLDFFQRIVCSDTFDSYVQTHEYEKLIDDAIGLGVENNRFDFVFGIVLKFEKNLNIPYIMHRMERNNHEFFLVFVDNLKKTHMMEDVDKWTRECFNFNEDPKVRITREMYFLISSKQIHVFLDYIHKLTETHTTNDIAECIRECLNLIILRSLMLVGKAEFLFKNEIKFIFHQKMFFSLFHDVVGCYLKDFILRKWMSFREIESMLTFHFNGFSKLKCLFFSINEST